MGKSIVLISLYKLYSKLQLFTTGKTRRIWKSQCVPKIVKVHVLASVKEFIIIFSLSKFYINIYNLVKCCGLHQVYNFAFTSNSPKKGCQNPTGDYFNPTLYKNFNRLASNSNTLAPHYIEKYPSTFKYECHQNITTIMLHRKTAEIIASFTVHNYTGHPFKLREDGKILYRESDGVCSVLDPFKINSCVDGMANYSPEYHEFDNDPEELVIFLCSLPPAEVRNFINQVFK